MITEKFISAVAGRKVAPFVMAADDVSGFESLSQIGIQLPRYKMQEMAHEMYKAFGPAAYGREGVAMDTIQQLYTVPSIPNLIQNLQSWLPGIVRQVTTPRLIDEIVGIVTAGAWEDEMVVQAYLENTGVATPYGDLANIPLASWNQQWATRNVVRFESGIRVGMLEEARSGRNGINTAQEKRMSATLALDIARNNIGFFGYNTGNNNTYGFLNDPNLPAYTTVAATGTGASTLWSTKTFQQIAADIRVAIVQLRTQTTDLVDPRRTPMTLVVPTDSVDYLSTTTDFGVTVYDWLAKNYPGIRVISAPQLNNANGGANVFYLFADRIEGSTDDGAPFVQVVPTRFRMLGMMKEAKGYVEDYSNATAGIMLKRPFSIVRYTGI